MSIAKKEKKDICLETAEIRGKQFYIMPEHAEQNEALCDGVAPLLPALNLSLLHLYTYLCLEMSSQT